VIVLDTTVLVYAVGDQHRQRDACREILRAQARGAIDAVTTIEVIQEFAHVRARRRGRSDAVALARDYAVALRLLIPTADDLELGLSLYEAHPSLGAFDAILAATALNHDARALISADRGFSTVPELRWIGPTSPALRDLL